MAINKGEYGGTLYVNMGEDISSATAYKMILQPPFGDSLEKTATLGTETITHENRTYTANQYITYTIANGDIDQSGQWRKRGKVTQSATNVLLSNYEKFTVLE